MARHLEAVMRESAKDQLGGILVDITGWQLGCENAARVSREIIGAIDRGFVGFRMHYAQAFPNGVEFYEVTDKGLDYVRENCGEVAAKWATENRAWYRSNTSKPKPPSQKE